MKNIIQILFVVHSITFAQTQQQVNQAKDLIKKRGLSEEQVRSLAKQQGYSEKKINEYITKEKGLIKNKEQKNEEVIGSIKTENISLNKTQTEKIAIDKISVNEISPSEKNIPQIKENQSKSLDYFGYDIFNRDPALFQETSVGVVDPNYLIGPSDEIIVMLWGETQFRQVLTVDREGFIFIPEIGQVFVNGLNLKLLESKLFRVFSQSYASLNPPNRKATTFLDISLGNLRPLRIQVLGEVAQPGAYTVSPSATLFSSLYYFNGPTYFGSLRDIQLIRGGEKTNSIDFYDYLLTGEKPEDQKLQLDDVIFIPRRLRTISVEGEINRPGIYELTPEEGLSSLINIAGGLKVTSYLDRAQIDRVVSFDNRKDLNMDRIIIDIDLKKVLSLKNDIALQDGDKITIFSISEIRQNLVTIDGAINRPGDYDIGDSLRISELIERADGLMGDAYTKKIDITRINSDYSEKLIKLNLRKIIEGNINENILLKNNDRVKIYSLSEMVDKQYVYINGHVKNEGSYLLQEGMTLYDLIFKAGNFVDEDFKKRTYLNRAEIIRYSKINNDKEIIPFNLELVLEKKGIANIPLVSQDLVLIYSDEEIKGKGQFVTISGHVKQPNTYELYKSNMRLNDLLFKSGGFEDKLYKSKTFSERADLIRFDEDRITKSIIPFNLDSVLYNPKTKQNYLLLAGDEVRVYSEDVFNSPKIVTINGEVKNPGTYEYKSGMNLLDLILECSGLSNNRYKYRIEIARKEPEKISKTKFANIIVLEIRDDLKIIKSELGESIEDIKLQPYDFIEVRSNPYLSKQRTVEIIGEVLYPGKYAILKYDETITDIIERSGGLLPSSFLMGSKYYRDSVKINVDFLKIIKNKNSKLNFNIQHNDKIEISRQPNTVVVDGAVNNPGIHKYVPNKRFKYYLAIAGGLSPKAEKSNIWMELPNGDSKKLKSFSLISPKVYDGSVIRVGFEEESEPFDKTEYAKELTSILANLAQIIGLFSLTR